MFIIPVQYIIYVICVVVIIYIVGALYMYEKMVDLYHMYIVVLVIIYKIKYTCVILLMSII